EREELNTMVNDTSTVAVEEHDNRLKAEHENVLRLIKHAKEVGDTDEEVKLLDELARIRSERIVLDQVKRNIQKQVPKQQEQKPAQQQQPQPQPQKPVQPNRRALDWHKRNMWYGGTSNKDRIMTQMA